MQVKSIAKCSKGSILQYFQPSFDCQYLLVPIWIKNHLTYTLIVFLQEFSGKVNFENKVNRRQQKHDKLPSMQKVDTLIDLNYIYGSGWVGKGSDAPNSQAKIKAWLLLNVLIQKNNDSFQFTQRKVHLSI